jgi:hypothetical protein
LTKILPVTHFLRMPNLTDLFDARYFWRSDNARFWFYQEKKKKDGVDRGDESGVDFSSPGAVLITDTGLWETEIRSLSFEKFGRVELAGWL